MATPPWVILNRILRVGPRTTGAAAQEQHATAAEPDFSLELALPPRVTVLFAGRRVHPDPNNRDAFPYIIAASRHCLLAHFAAYPFHGTQFYNSPFFGNLVVVRDFQTAPGSRAAASVVRVPERAGRLPILWNLQNVALATNGAGDYVIAELQADKTSDRATLVYLRSDRHDGWVGRHVAYPLAAPAHGRERIPHGAVHVDGRLWWFDLTWGILSYATSFMEPGLVFHDLPDGRRLDNEPPYLHTKRCVAASGNKLRYVEIIVTEGGEAAARVSMWSRSRTPDGAGWQWDADYAVSFEEIWDDGSYRETGLPRDVVPLLVVVCPSDPNLVYFALGQHMLGVNVPARRVVHHGAFEPLDSPWQEPVSSRYVVPWVLPPEIAQALPPPPPDAGVPELDVLLAAAGLCRLKHELSRLQSQAEDGGC